ncbi:MAG: alpha/beta fold hydrolase [Myxococcales bacterium]|nr:alpha/beta fold hydrolase [Myxococcales bacterium]
MPFVEAPALPHWIEEMMPFQRKAFSLRYDGRIEGTMHFVDHGSPQAQPLLLVHGNPAWSFLWRKIIQALDPQRFRCIAPDLLGFGASTKLPKLGDHSLKAHVDAVTQLVEALDLKQVILVGQDWGGPIATGVGARCPERIAGIVLGNTSVLAPKRPKGTLFHRFAQLPILSNLVFYGFNFPQSILQRVQGDPTSIQREVKKAYLWPFRSFSSRSAPLALARMVPNHPEHPTMQPLQQIEAWLRSFTGPMALVWGERDPVLGKALKRHTQAFPQATVTITQAGHFLQEEVPQEFVLAIEQIAKSSL